MQLSGGTTSTTQQAPGVVCCCRPTPGLQLVDNKFERFNGIFVWAGEQIYMGGSLGLHNVSLRNTTVVDGGVQVCAGLSNVTCQDTTFVSKGRATNQAQGCSAGGPLRFSKILD